MFRLFSVSACFSTELTHSANLCSNTTAMGRSDWFFVIQNCKHTLLPSDIFYQILAHCAIHFFLLFRSMVKDGIPHSLRPYVWLRLAGAMLKKNTSEVTYKQVKNVSNSIFLTDGIASDLALCILFL